MFDVEGDTEFRVPGPGLMPASANGCRICVGAGAVG